jgi:hypothetical protein
LKQIRVFPNPQIFAEVSMVSDSINASIPSVPKDFGKKKRVLI